MHLSPSIIKVFLINLIFIQFNEMTTPCNILGRLPYYNKQYFASLPKVNISCNETVLLPCAEVLQLNYPYKTFCIIKEYIYFSCSLYW